MTDKEQINLNCPHLSFTDSGVICHLGLGLNGDIKPTVFGKSLDEIHEALLLNNRYKQALEPFEDEYFKGLDTKQIAELAKKSIRLTTENRKLEAVLDEIEGICSQDRTIVNVCLISTQLEEPRVKYDIQDEILDIICQAKGEGQ